MKIYEFDIPKTLLSDLDIVIRDKEDIIKVLLHTIKYISFSESKKEISNDCNKIVLVVDKMSRLFFHYEKKKPQKDLLTEKISDNRHKTLYNISDYVYIPNGTGG